MKKDHRAGILSIIIAAVLSYLVFSDTPDIYLIIGAGLIIAGGIMVAKYKTAA